MNTSKKIRVIAALGTLSAAVWAGTFASFTDSATSTATFTAGTVDLVAGGDADDAQAFTTLQMSNLKPGDRKVAELVIANPASGTALPFNYSMTTSATSADTKNLAGRLLLKAAKVADSTACTAAAVNDAAYESAFLAAAPNVIAEGALSSAAMASRALAAGASDVWCFEVTMPNSATAGEDDAFQGAATTATFTFNAVQQ